MNVDPAVLKEIDKISEEHCKYCPCLKDEIEETSRVLAIEGAKEVKSNPLLRESPSASLDVLLQNERKALQVVAGKHFGEPCVLQSEYALGLWSDFEKKYNIENPEVRILVGRIITMCLRSYKMSGEQLLTSRFDRDGNTIIEAHPYLIHDRAYSESISKMLLALDELEFGKKITIKNELPDRDVLFRSDKYILVEDDDKSVDKSVDKNVDESVVEK